MRGARHGPAPLLTVGALAAVAVYAMFSGTDRSGTAGEEVKPWWLGADLGPATSASHGGVLGPQIGGATGVRVRRVWSHSPAKRSGLAARDLILRMNGAPVSTPGEVEAALRAPGGSRKMDLVILRNTETRPVTVVLQKEPRFARNVSVVLVLLAVAFALLYLTSLDRVAVVGCSAVFAIVLGTVFGFYGQGAAFRSIRMGTLALLLGMGLVTAALEETGFFSVIARRIGELARGDWSRLMVLLCVTTFLLSAHVNNLTTILVILPVTLGLARDLRFDPAPFVVAEIVSSNLGGASSMIGDFPNMLIASETGRHFHEFLLYMMPPCLVELAITIWFMKRTRGVSKKTRESDEQEPSSALQTPASSNEGGKRGQRESLPRDTRGLASRQIRHALPAQGERGEAAAFVPEKMRQALLVLGGVIAAFFFCGRFAVPPATVALAGGATILLLWNRAAPRLVGKGGFSDILFFACLFVLVGCAEGSGLLDIVATWMLDVSGGGRLGLTLVLMWTVAAVTMFLGAGPTTALFVPIVMGFGVSEPHGLLLWALSLGVCAGSSATITGATAGPVALTKVADFVEEERRKAVAMPAVDLSFLGYAKMGVPLMLVFLVVSSVYIWGLSVWS